MKLDLIPNITLFYQLGLFALVFICVKTFLVGPFLNLREKRQHSTSGLRKELEELRVKTESIKAKYEGKFGDAKLHAISFREELKKLADIEAAKKINEGRLQAEQKLKEILKNIEAEKNQAQSELKNSVSVYAKNIAEKILERTVNS